MANALHVASRKGLFRFRRKGKGWAADGAPAFLGEPVTAVLADGRSGALYVVLRTGQFGVKLHRSDDDGKIWRELPSPAFPEAAAGDDGAPAVDMVWTLVPGGGDRAGALWAGTLPGALFRSADGGESWSLVESLWNEPRRKEWQGGGYDLPGIHSVLVDPRDSKKLTVGVSTGGVWRSDDDGKSWGLVGKGLRAEYMPPAMAYDQLMQDVHRLAHCAAAPDVVWCQHHNGMFRSEDGGDTFAEIKDVKPAVFGFAVAAHPKDAKTAWFAPAVKDECRVPVGGKLVVTRTGNGGKTFKAFGSGLPAEDCYDLIYRHALAVDDEGTELAMGSTTGNLWISDDSGESWSHVAGHLPPIAQVTFA